MISHPSNKRIHIDKLNFDDIHKLTKTAQGLQIHEKTLIQTQHSWTNSFLISVFLVIIILFTFKLFYKKFRKRSTPAISPAKKAASSTIIKEPTFSELKGEELC